MARIRQAELSDYPSVAALEELVFQAHREARPDYFKDQAGTYSRQEFEALLSQPCPIAVVAEREGTVVGLCFGKVEETPENQWCRSRKVAFLEDLVTLPQCRGQGIATELLAAARTQAVAAGAESLELCVWGFNQQARRLYEKLGMRVQYYRMEEPL